MEQFSGGTRGQSLKIFLIRDDQVANYHSEGVTQNKPIH